MDIPWEHHYADVHSFHEFGLSSPKDGGAPGSRCSGNLESRTTHPPACTAQYHRATRLASCWRRRWPGGCLPWPRIMDYFQTFSLDPGRTAEQAPGAGQCNRSCMLLTKIVALVAFDLKGAFNGVNKTSLDARLRTKGILIVARRWTRISRATAKLIYRSTTTRPR